jgi:hypothetical protein
MSAAAAAAARGGGGGGGGDGSSAVVVVRVPEAAGALHRAMLFSGALIDARPPPPLPAPHAPLALDTFQRWLGSAAPGRARVIAGRAGGGAAAAGGAGEGDDDEAGGGGGGAGSGASLEAMLGLAAAGAGAAGAPDADPIAAALSAARGKRRLRAFPRGAEDAVVGYWRFEKSDEELAAEKARGAELKRVRVEASACGGVWGCPAAGGGDGGGGGGGGGGGAAGEALAPTGMPVTDLSRQALRAMLFDALALLARARGAAAAAAAAPAALALSAAALSGTPAAKAPGASELAPFVRAALGSVFDAPFDPGEPGKVKEPRAAVLGANTAPPPAPGGGGARALALGPAPPRVALAALLAPGGAAATGGPSNLPPVPLSRALALLARLVAWAVAIPLPR